MAIQRRKEASNPDTDNPRARRLVHKAAASLQYRTAQTLAAVAKYQGDDTGKFTEAMLQLAVLDLSSSGYDAESVAERLHLDVNRVRRLQTDGLAALSAQTQRAAEIVRAQADAKLSRLESKLASITDCDETDTTSLIRAIEVQARLIGQRVDLYGAKVREADGDLASAVQDLLRESAQLDRDRIGHEPPASGTTTLAIAAEPDPAAK